MSKKAVLFDLDDTLSIGHPAYNKALEATAQEWAHKFPGMDFDRFVKVFDTAKSDTFARIGSSANAGNRMFYFQRVMELEKLPHDYKWLIHLIDVYWKAYLAALKPREDAGETLEELKRRGVKVGIITNFVAEIQARKLVSMGLDKYIDVMVTAEEAGITKPSPVIFQTALERIGSKAADTLMVGDDIVPDIKGGNAAGMETALVENEWSKYTPEDKGLATYRISTLKEILDIVI